MPLVSQKREAQVPGRPVLALASQLLPISAQSIPQTASSTTNGSGFAKLSLNGLVRYWHLLSLDAPSVATLWAWSLARAFHLALTCDSLLLLFAGTWLIYVADRILDGLRSKNGQHSPRLRERHFFYMRHRAAAIRVAIPVSAFLAWLVFAHMLPSARRSDILIFVIAIAYFCLVHLRGPEIERWFPKELIVAIVFASATAVPAWSRLAANALAENKSELALVAALFAALCWLNCIAIEKWETSRNPSVAVGPAHNRHWYAENADAITRCGQRRLRQLSATIAAAALFAGALLLHSALLPAELCFAAALSAALFLALDRSRLGAFHLRIAADAALLTPLLILVVR